MVFKQPFLSESWKLGAKTLQFEPHLFIEVYARNLVA